MKTTMPNFVIAGVPKSGTTAIFTFLSAHPMICGSSIKETLFLNPLIFGEEVSDMDLYGSYFENCNDALYRMEASINYLYGGARLAKCLKSISPDIKVAFVLRNPVDRIISFYKFKKINGELPGDISLGEYINTAKTYKHEDFNRRGDHQVFRALHHGIYSKYLTEWYDVLGDRVSVFFYEDFKRNNKMFIKKVCDCLDVESNFYNDFNFTLENKTISCRSKTLHRWCMDINRRVEPFFRKNMQVKIFLRKIYHLLNSVQDKESVEDDTIRMLNEFYAPHNSNLLSLLHSQSVEYIEFWVK